MKDYSIRRPGFSHTTPLPSRGPVQAWQVPKLAADSQLAGQFLTFLLLYIVIFFLSGQAHNQYDYPRD
jgi:hypothetical protein